MGGGGTLRNLSFSDTSTSAVVVAGIRNGRRRIHVPITFLVRGRSGIDIIGGDSFSSPAGPSRAAIENRPGTRR